jgi:hypothetical protein
VEEAQIFFQEHAMEPIWGSLSGENGQKSKKWMKAKSVFQRLDKHKYEGFQHLTLLNAPAAAVEDTFSANISLDISTHENEFKPAFVLVYDAALEAFTQPLVTQLFQRFAAPCMPRYGYAFQRSFRQGPAPYVFGTIVGLNSYKKSPEEKFAIEKEEWEITRWSQRYRRSGGDYKLGDLRNVYPFNWLCPVHLTREVTVGGITQTVQRFIESEASHGTLTLAAPERWIWHVDAAHLEAVRKKLRPSGMLIASLDAPL